MPFSIGGVGMTLFTVTFRFLAGLDPTCRKQPWLRLSSGIISHWTAPPAFLGLKYAVVEINSETVDIATAKVGAFIPKALHPEPTKPRNIAHEVAHTAHEVAHKIPLNQPRACQNLD